MPDNKTAQTPCVLFVDDDEATTRSLIRSLIREESAPESHPHEAHRQEFHKPEYLTATNTEAALEVAKQRRPEAFVVDLSLDPVEGPQSGLRFIETLRSFDLTSRILVLTGHNDSQLGVESLHLGANSFLVKPVEAKHLHALIQDAVSFAALKRQYSRERSVPIQLAALSGLQTKSESMQAVLDAVAYAASNTQPVLLLGETGVGKGVIAQAIHRASSRATSPFIRCQPSFGNSDLVSSELFGHQKGAFTGATEHRKGLIEEANRGSLFIDEIDELPPETQVLLLHVLQEKVFRRLGASKDLHSNFRLIAASNQPIETSLRSGKLRKDFYHRIAHLTIAIPPLRDRREDIPDLANHFLREVLNRDRLKLQGLTTEAIDRLVKYPWPGNVRELQAVVEGGAYRADFHQRRFIETDDLSLSEKASHAGIPGTSFRQRVQLFEKQLVQEALEKCDNNQKKAAESLQLDRSSLRRILERGEK